MEQQQDMEPKQEMPRIDVGGVLRQARERVGMSVEDVAARLKFAPRQITALEEGNFDQLPQTAFVRGFVRSYARLLQLDENALLKALPSAPAQEAPAETAARTDMVSGEVAARAENIRWLAGALVVALVLGILAWQRDGTQAPKSPASAKTETETKPAIDVRPAGEPENIAAAVLPASAPTATPAAPVAPAAPAAPAVAAPQVAPLSASAVAAAKEAARKRAGRLLRLEFDEDSWVEVKDANGKILLSMLGKQGTAQSVAGPVPLSVTIGNARGVRLYYKGQAVDFASEAEANVAHLIME